MLKATRSFSKIFTLYSMTGDLSKTTPLRICEIDTWKKRKEKHRLVFHDFCQARLLVTPGLGRRGICIPSVRGIQEVWYYLSILRVILSLEPISREWRIALDPSPLNSTGIKTTTAHSIAQNCHRPPLGRRIPIYGCTLTPIAVFLKTLRHREYSNTRVEEVIV